MKYKLLLCVLIIWSSFVWAANVEWDITTEDIGKVHFYEDRVLLSLTPEAAKGFEKITGEHLYDTLNLSINGVFAQKAMIVVAVSNGQIRLVDPPDEVTNILQNHISKESN